jgi:trk system potassium uptake protein TrkA
MARTAKHEGQVLVIGLGRFGSAIAITLERLGHEVMGVDADPRIVQELAGDLTHVVEADATNLDALRQVGAGDFERAVVGIGTDLEASILTTANLVDLGVKSLWAKADSAAHGRILERIGAHNVVFPEQDMGERVAHLATGRMLDYLELDDSFALVKTIAPAELIGKTLADAHVRSKYGITVVCIKQPGSQYTFATADTVVQQGAIIVLAGKPEYAEGFAELT